MPPHRTDPGAHDLRRRIIPWLCSVDRRFHAPGIAEHFGVHPRTARRILADLLESGIVVDVDVEHPIGPTGRPCGVRTVYESAIGWRGGE